MSFGVVQGQKGDISAIDQAAINASVSACHTSETNAGNSASASATSAYQSSEQATRSEGFKNDAGGYKDGASGAASGASASAAAAVLSAADALQSSLDAAGSALAAAGSATAAQNDVSDLRAKTTHLSISGTSSAFDTDLRVGPPLAQNVTLSASPFTDSSFYSGISIINQVAQTTSTSIALSKTGRSTIANGLNLTSGLSVDSIVAPANLNVNFSAPTAGGSQINIGRNTVGLVANSVNIGTTTDAVNINGILYVNGLPYVPFNINTGFASQF